jgi:hypothetical protein
MGTFVCDRCNKRWPDLVCFCCPQCYPHWARFQFAIMMIFYFVLPIVVIASIALFVVWLFS